MCVWSTTQLELQVSRMRQVKHARHHEHDSDGPNPHCLDTYEPDIVVAMMGANDTVGAACPLLGPAGTRPTPDIGMPITERTGFL